MSRFVVSEGEKRCCTCRLVKPLTEFHPSKGYRSKDGRRRDCRKCHNAEVLAYARRNPKKRRLWARTHVLKREYGLSMADYDRMVIEQDGRCLICTQSSDCLCVDHCHATNKVRGLLCHNCNLAVGNLRDSVANAEALVEYLRGSA